MDTYSAVIPSLGRAAADAIEDGLGQPVSGPKVDPGFDRIRMTGGVFAGRWVHPTGQYSKKYPQVEGHVLRLSGRHAKLRREGYGKASAE
jgi:hypothetical protein